MSILRKIPYIEAKLSELTLEQVEDLLDVINSTNNGDEIYSLVDNDFLLRTEIGDSSSYIKAITLQLDKQKQRSGIVVYASDVSLLIAYNRYQAIQLFELDLDNGTYKFIDEDCTIEELRRIINDILYSGGGGEITPEALQRHIEGSADIVVDINETDDKLQVSLDQDAKDNLYFKLAPISAITHEMSGGNTLIVVNAELFDNDSAYELLLEIEGSGSHYGTKLLALPYNNSQCFTSSGLYMAEAEDNRVITTMDSTGQINITIYGYEMTPESEDTKIHYRKLY